MKVETNLTQLLSSLSNDETSELIDLAINNHQIDKIYTYLKENVEISLGQIEKIRNTFGDEAVFEVFRKARYFDTQSFKMFDYPVGFLGSEEKAILFSLKKCSKKRSIIRR